MKRIGLSITLIIYTILAVFITICLLAYNEYNVTEIGKYSLVKAEKDFNNYQKGSLLLIDNTKVNKVKKGDYLFFYNAYETEKDVILKRVKAIEEVNKKEKTFIFEDDSYISSEYAIGTTKNTKAIGFIGTILLVLESKAGYLCLVILPLLVLFIYEIYSIIQEIKRK